MDHERKILWIRVREWQAVGMFMFGVTVGAMIPDANMPKDLVLMGIITGWFCILFPPIALGAEDGIAEVNKKIGGG